MYSTYLSGIGSNGSFNLLVSGGADYASSGVLLKNDITASGSGNRGLGIRHSSSDETSIDLRTQANSGKTFTFRLQDDSTPQNYSNLLTVSDDNLSSTSRYGVQVGGRLKASQFSTSTADTRDPVSPGLYLGHDLGNKAYLKINRGTGLGGFKFQTYDSVGNLYKSHLELSEYGYVKMPQYADTNDTLDIEPTAIAAFDATGKLVRKYQYNARLRSIEERLAASEEDAYTNTPNFINTVIRRLNSLEFFSAPITELSLQHPSQLYTVTASEIQISVSTSLATAQTSTWQDSLLSSIATSTSTPQSSLSVVSVSSSPLLTLAKGATSGAGGVYVVLRVSPSDTVAPKMVTDQIKDMAKDGNSRLISLLTTSLGSNPIDTSYTPKQRDVISGVPSPTPPPVVTARYIRFQYGNSNNGNARTLNLAGIKVYSSASGSDIITSSMATSSLDLVPGYSGSNLLDNNDSTYYHSNGASEYPWVQIDLGSNTAIYKVEIKNRVDCCKGRIAGVQMTLTDSSNNLVYTSSMAKLKNDSVTYIEGASSTLTWDFYSYWPALGTAGYGSNGTAAGQPTPAPTPSGQTIIKNYNDTDPLQNIYNQLFFIWTPPVNCRITSVNVYASGGLNNGGFILLKVFKGSGWSEIYATAYGITKAQDNELPVSSWSSQTFNAGEPLIIQWTTLESYRYFSTRKNATNDLPVTLVYTPL
jgi:hypothetical protein